MKPERPGDLATLLLVPIGACLVVGALIEGDPMLAAEIAVGGALLAWAALVLRDLAGSARLAAELSGGAEDFTLFGVPCRVTRRLGPDALVIGTVRPRIYMGTALLEALADDEVEAVVYHEDHHRRTRAPLRAAALGAWLRLLGRSAGIRRVVLDRLADLEALADADAIGRGSSPRSLARALIKGDLSLRPASLSYAADRRIARLLDRAAGHPGPRISSVPLEWLPLAGVVAVGLGCHLWP